MSSGIRYSTKSLVDQNDGKNSNTISINIPDAVVFVQGINIANWVMSISITLTYEGENTASVTVSEPNKIFTLTKENLNGKWRSGSSYNEYDRISTNELPKQLLYDYKNANQVSDTFGGTKWNLNAENCIIDEGDTVRIFFKAPWKTGKQGAEEKCWFPVFTGYIINYKHTAIPVGGMDTTEITFECKDAKHYLKKSRTLLNNKSLEAAKSMGNDASVGTKNIDPRQDLFKDLVPPSSHVWQNILTNKSPTGIVRTILLGRYQSEQGGKDKPEEYEYNPSGKYGNIDEELDEIFYEDHEMVPWYKKLLFGDKGEPLSYNDVKTIGLGSDTFGEYSPHGKKVRVRFLSPKKGSWDDISLGELKTQDSPSPQLIWTTRLDILTEFMEKIDYRFWITGNGDFVFEPPMWVDTRDVYKSDPAIQDMMVLKEADGPVKYDTSVDSSNVKTVLRVQASIPKIAQTAGANTIFQNSSVAIYLPALILKYGVIADTKAVITASTDDVCMKLGIWGLIEMMMCLSTLKTYTYEPILWRALLPNKPFEVPGAHHEGTTNSVTYEYDVKGKMTLSFELGALKHKNKSGNYVYDVFGTEKLPFSWKNKWDDNQESIESLLIRIVCPQTNPQGADKNKANINQGAQKSQEAMLSGADPEKPEEFAMGNEPRTMNFPKVYMTSLTTTNQTSGAFANTAASEAGKELPNHQQNNAIEAMKRGTMISGGWVYSSDVVPSNVKA